MSETEVLVEKVARYEKGHLYFVKRNPNDQEYLDLHKVVMGRKKKEEQDGVER